MHWKHYPVNSTKESGVSLVRISRLYKIFENSIFQTNSPQEVKL